MNATSQGRSLDDLRAELDLRKSGTLQMGGADKLAQRREQGLLNARERIDRLFDPGSFLESGQLAVSFRKEDRDRTPADGKITGWGKVEGRDVACVSNDFTVMGASSSLINSRKIKHLKDLATRRGAPMVYLGESTGARMPDVMGAEAMGFGDNPKQYQRLRETPWATALLGHCYGSSAWFAAMSDFVVMRKGAILAVSSPKLTALATGENLEPEELGGWRLHSEVTGFVDQVVESDEAAIDAIKRFLSYLPSHAGEAPPCCPVPEESSGSGEAILKYFPTERRRAYDVRKVLSAVVDADSLFELKAGFGKSLVTAFARIDGRSVGLIANNPLHKGGAIDADACTKATTFLVLCDSFNVPVVFMVDQPGFLIGIEGERRGMPGKVMNWMNALSLVTTPKICVVMRKNYGQAVLNMGGGFFIVPALNRATPLHMTSATGTSLMAIALTSGGVVLVSVLSGHAPLWSLVLPLMTGALLGMSIARRFVRELPVAALRLGFAALLSVVALLMVWRSVV